MGTAFNGEQGFINLLLVDEKYRRKGLDGELLTRCLQSLGDRNVTLYCAYNMASFYQKYGFKTGQDPSHVFFRRFVPNKTALKGRLSKLLISLQYRV